MKILFICLGNTCRSPMAHSIMQQQIEEKSLDWTVDSAALRSWNIGRKPEVRLLKILGENGLTLEHLCRMITREDFFNFDYILTMDEHNLNELRVLKAKYTEANGDAPTAKTELLGSYIGRKEDEIIRDPYFSDDINVFRHTFTQISESCTNFVKQHS